MSKLTTINLAQNPISSTVEYPMNVFALQESLQYVDDWYRPSVAPGQPLPPPMPIGSLETQLDAANAALSLQERTVSANGHELAKLCASLTPQSTKSSITTHHHMSETEILEKFPYFRLLQMWRKEALSAIMARTVAEQRLQDATTEMKRERQALISRRQEAEMAASLWKERYAGLDKTCGELQRQMHLQAEELRRAADEASQRDAQLAYMTQQMRQLTVYLLHQRRAAHETAVVEAATAAHTVERLRQLEDRLSAAAERVAFTAEVVAHRELQVRNDLAAAEAERRLLQMSRATHPPSQLTIGPVANHQEGKGVLELDASSMQMIAVECTALSTHQEGVHLSPEAEALLKAVFRGLDVNDTGVVEVSLLLQSFYTECAADMHPGCASESKTNCFDTASLTELGVLVQEVLGITLFSRLSQALWECDANEDLSWGEFLLQLMPSTECSCRCHRARRCALDGPELRDLRKLHLLGDGEWGVVPLHLPAASRVTKKGAQGREGKAWRAHTCDCAAHQHAQRLQRERAYLMNRLQDMTRTLERRAEGIKSYFESSIRGEQLKSQRLTLQVSDLQHTVTVARERQVELEQTLQAARERFDAKVQQLESTIDELNVSKSLRYTELQSRFENQLAEESARAALLEKQLQSAKSDCEKRDFKIRTLQKDVRRLDTDSRQLSTSRALQVGEISSLNERLKAADAELAEAQRVQAALTEDLTLHEGRWNEERRELNERIQGLQEKLTELQGQLDEAKMLETMKITAQATSQAAAVEATQGSIQAAPVAAGPGEGLATGSTYSPYSATSVHNFPSAPAYPGMPVVSSALPPSAQPAPPSQYYSGPPTTGVAPTLAAVPTARMSPAVSTPQHPPLPPYISGFRDNKVRLDILLDKLRNVESSR